MTRKEVLELALQLSPDDQYWLAGELSHESIRRWREWKQKQGT